MTHQKLFRAAAVLAIMVLAVVILVFSKPVLVPVVFAGLLAMLLLPVMKWLQRKGLGQVPAIISCVFLLVLLLALVVFFVSWQVSDLASDASKIEQQFTAKYQQAQQMISSQLGISKSRQEAMMKEQQSGSSGKLSGTITSILGGIAGFVTDFIIVLVYIFLFMMFRGKLKGFVLRLVPAADKEKTTDIIDKSQKVSQKYLGGLALMVVILWVMYGIGFSIAGVKNAIFFAILCGLLEIIPFIGNVTGTLLTLTMAMVQGGGSNILIGILITYVLVQFIQTYLIEPLIVGSEVNINPMFTILGLIIGEAIWGIPGMVLAIPILGITKVICDHVDALKPYGYLIGEDKKGDSKFKKKIKGLFGKSGD